MDVVGELQGVELSESPRDICTPFHLHMCFYWKYFGANGNARREVILDSLVIARLSLVQVAGLSPAR